MKALWEKYVAWFVGLQLRERNIISGAAVVSIAFIGYSYAVEPALLREKKAATALRDTNMLLAALEQQKVQSAALVKDPDQMLRSELAQLEATYAEQAQRFRVVERSTVTPDEMPALLESLMSRSPGLQLLAMHTLPPEPLIKPAATEKGAEKAPVVPVAANLYRHGVELKIAGSYPDLLAYATNLEKAAGGLGWHSLELNAETYPRSVLSLTVQTLSLRPDWLVL
jgi:MSHA biogenesis protein MshJ